MCGVVGPEGQQQGVPVARRVPLVIAEGVLNSSSSQSDQKQLRFLFGRLLCYVVSTIVRGQVAASMAKQQAVGQTRAHCSIRAEAYTLGSWQALNSLGRPCTTVFSQFLELDCLNQKGLTIVTA